METRQIFQQSSRNMQWLADHYDDLKQQFDGKWIAVSDGRVFASDENLERVKDAVTRYKTPETVVVEYMTAQPIAMFF